MNPSRVLFLALILASLSVTACAPRVRKPMSVNRNALNAIALFKGAAVVPKKDEVRWDEALTVGNPPQSVRIGGLAHHHITVSYPDEVEPRRVFGPVDYTNVLEVRVSGSTLFVYRAAILVWTEYRLTVFDLVRRRRVGDYLVSPDDMPPRPPKP